MGVFGASGQSRTFDFQSGDVGYVPFALGHYIENTGTAPLRFLEMFKSSYFADLSLDTWKLPPPPFAQAVLNHISGSRGGIAGVYQRHDWAAEKRAASRTRKVCAPIRRRVTPGCSSTGTSCITGARGQR